MKKRVIIHGGHFKTGTTAAQMLLADNRALLAAHGVHYPIPASDFAPHQHGVILAVRDEAGLDSRLNALRALLLSFKESDSETLLLSAEMLASFHEATFARLSPLLQETDATFVLMLRSWNGFLNSRWRQNLSHGDSLSAQAYVSRVIDEFSWTLDGDFSIIFDRARSTGMRLSAIYYSKANALRDMLRFVGLQADTVEHLVTRAKRENTSEKFPGYEWRRLANALVAQEIGRPADARYASLRDGVDFRHDLRLGRKCSAFRTSGAEAALLIEQAIIEAKQERTLAALGAPECDWRSALAQNLVGLGVEPPPPAWGDDEREAPFTFCDLAPDDFPSAARIAFLDHLMRPQ